MSDDEKLIMVGYWYEVGPRMELGGEFGRSVGPDPCDFVDEGWDSTERARVIAYLRSGRIRTRWRGVSWCRIGEGLCTGMGSADLTDGVYLWPSGYVHYLEKHAVRPPLEFVQHALSRQP